MKRLVSLILLLALAFSLTSCELAPKILELFGDSKEETQEITEIPEKNPSEEEEKEDNSNEEENNTVVENTVIKEFLSTDRERAYYKVLEGKTINFIGDSLLAGAQIGKEYAWPNLLGEKYSMTYDNQAISGCTLSACEGGENPIVSRYANMPDNNPDIVVFEGGRNDYNKDAAIGMHTRLDPESYKGAMAILIKGLREKYPNAIIVAVTFWGSNDRQNSGGKVCGEYTQAMIDVCRAMSVPCINASDENASGIKMTDAAFRAQYSCKPSDVCHLNFEGMKLALRFFEKELAEIYESNKK